VKINDQYVTSESETQALPLITTCFSDYEPPFDVVAAVRGMLSSVPPKYLVGMSEVVLTNTAALNRSRRRDVTKSRKRKVRQAAARGLYHPAWNGKPARIEILVDNTLRNWSAFFLWSSFVREQLLGDVLFHEIGHHIHYSVRPEYREKEDVADAWKVRLERNYHRTQFSWLRPIALLLQFVLGPAWSRIMKSNLDLMLKKGYTSRAEHEESVKKYNPQD